MDRTYYLIVTRLLHIARAKTKFSAEDKREYEEFTKSNIKEKKER